ncbi:hypothetical protein [Streptomyces macrosporus]|uniref:Uncharacterized protein n=1 Tax=Streptomyces macrosporus TaxID=44032 RepID=A0ABP5WYN5_9ACTN
MTTSPVSPSTAPILITGGTGKTGRRVAAGLRRRGLAARVASRSGPVRFDWADESTWEPALSGVRAVYLVDEERYRREPTARGHPDDYADLTATLFAHIRRGRSAALSDGVRRVLGREPVDFTDCARRIAAARRG